jgi:hypothetical protein
LRRKEDDDDTIFVVVDIIFLLPSFLPSLRGAADEYPWIPLIDTPHYPFGDG